MENFIFNPSNKPAGLYWIEKMPQRPILGNAPYCKEYYLGQCKYTACGCLHYEEAYQKRLSLAISQSIQVENQQQLENLIVEKYSPDLDPIFKLKPGEIYQLDCKVEKIKPFIFNEGNYQNSCTICKSIFDNSNKMQRVCKPCCDTGYAVVSPKDKSPESCPTIKDCKHYEPRHCLLNGCKQEDAKEQPKQEEKLYPLSMVKKAFETFRYVGFPHNNPTWEEFKKFNLLNESETTTSDGTPVSLPQESSEESIQCPYCNGDGFTAEHSGHSPDEPCNECPIQVQCEYCYATGRITTKLMKGHIESRNRPQSDDNLLF